MSQFHFDPASYLTMMREDVPRYDELQEVVAAATAHVEPRRILELGTGTGRPPGGYSSSIRAPAWSASTRARRCSRSHAQR